jgi:hypothetical protein
LKAISTGPVFRTGTPAIDGGLHIEASAASAICAPLPSDAADAPPANLKNARRLIMIGLL